MSSRQEEKERRRLEREEAERAAAASSSRRKRLGIALGAALAVAVGVIVALAVASGDDSSPGGSAANVPTQGQTNEAEAARAAGCELRTDPVEGRDHTGSKVTYRSNPPTSGDHDPEASLDGVYPQPPDLEQSVHALEHGRINIQYKPGTPAPTMRLLTSLVENYEVKGTPGYHALLFENQTRMEPAVAATAWTKALTCPSMNDRVYDAIRTFWRANVDKGPEFIP